LNEAFAVAAAVGDKNGLDGHAAQLVFEEGAQGGDLVPVILIVLKGGGTLENAGHDLEDGGEKEKHDRERDDHFEEGEATGAGSKNQEVRTEKGGAGTKNGELRSGD
jgi:hypothetical protein